MADKFPPLDEVVGAGVLPRMIELLQFASPTVLFEIAWSLTNIACGELRHAQALVRCNAIPILVDLLSHRTDSVRYDR